MPYSPEAELQVVGLNAGYGAKRVLWDVNIGVKAAAVTVVLGPNGAGKTTLLRSLVGMARRYSGSVLYRGSAVGGRGPRDALLRGITLLPQGRALFGSMTVRENLVMGIYRLHRRERRKSLSAGLEFVYELFPLLFEKRDCQAATLSGGQQQMLALGRSVLTRPSLLLLDEPSLGLAPIAIDALVGALHKLMEAGLSLLIAEQMLSVAYALGNTAYVLREGRVVFEGTASSLKSDTVDIGGHYFGA